MLALDINSASHLVAESASATGRLRRVPAIAVLEPPVLLLGEAASRRARLAPLYVSRVHWENPDDTPLSRNLPGATTHGELAYAQLNELWPPGERTGVVAISPAVSPEDVGRFAGLFAAAGRAPFAWVDAAVAGVATRPASKRALWVEVEASRAVLAELLRESDAEGEWVVRRDRVEVSRAIGMAAIDDAVARGIAQHCLRVARFDPLAVATTEQALYDLIPALHDALVVGRPASLMLGEADDYREVTVEPEDLESACSTLVNEVLRLVQSARSAGEPLTLHLGHRLAVLPGLVAALRALPGVKLDILSASAVTDGASRAVGTPAVSGEEVRWLVALPCVPPVELAYTALPAHEVPTHILWRGRAWPLSAVPLSLGRSRGRGRLVIDGSSAGLSREHCRLILSGGEAVVEDLSTYGTWVNGEKVLRRARLRVGDVLRLGVPGVELPLVSVEPLPPEAD